MYDYSQTLAKLVADGIPFVAITLVSIRGSAPQVVGAKAIVTKDGLRVGTVGGGKIEAAAIDHGMKLLGSLGQPCELVKWNLQTDVGMTCGGEVQLLFERHIANPWSIAVFGAGHIAQSFVPLLLTMQCRVTCIDPRQEWLDRLPQNHKLQIVCTDDMAGEVERLSDQTYFVLMTRGHASDLPILARILSTFQPPFVGVIGSEQKASILRRELAKQGFEPSVIDSYHCPLGLPIGDNTPAEISISISAQLLQVRDSIAGRK
ncbi:XdhC and CoxI family protein [Rubripirellula tenax]|uniref:XdhC and CoxI family protein n=1 Tax=Rubripirellula tenax TaxID=2528015 RepID=A0A5C6EJ25_9BACT|nr:XdhC family protein [Rubripirellula tenax]TWU47259.1 XdhC and CoxI family protein [Rubripirellula tenax]